MATTTKSTDIKHPLAFRCNERLPDGTRCPDSFNTEQGLRMHKVRIHSGKGWDTSGNFRKGRFSTGRRMATMVDLAEDAQQAVNKRGRKPEAGDRPHKCPICGASYKKRPYLGIHVRDVHNMSMFDLPPYKPLQKLPPPLEAPVELMGEEQDVPAEGKAVSGEVVVIVGVGQVRITGPSLRTIKEVIQQLEE